MATSNRGMGAALTPAFWTCVAATAAVAYGANAPWVKVGGLSLGGQDPVVRLAAPIDPVWIYAGAGVAAFGLLVFVLFRVRAAFLLSALGGGGVVTVLVGDYSELRETLDISLVAWGAYLTAAAAVILFVASISGLLAGARP